MKLPQLGEAKLGAEQLHPRELAVADRLLPERRTAWVGGRIALRSALREICSDAAAQPILQNVATGAPVLPSGVIGSISHTEGLAIAIACSEPPAPARVAVGVDVERAGRAISSRAARRILSAEERATLGAWPADAAAGAAAAPSAGDDLLLRFCIKEALYKALHPLLGRAIPWHSVRVYPRPDGTCAVQLDELAAEMGAAPGAPPLRAQVHWQRRGEFYLTAARASNPDDVS